LEESLGWKAGIEKFYYQNTGFPFSDGRPVQKITSRMHEARKPGEFPIRFLVAVTNCRVVIEFFAMTAIQY
jgi:hypothetical protein